MIVLPWITENKTVICLIILSIIQLYLGYLGIYEKLPELFNITYFIGILIFLYYITKEEYIITN